MDLKKMHTALVISPIFIGLATLSDLPAESKKWNTDERQVKLMQDINAGQKSKELSLDEANKLRKALSHIARKKAQMKRTSKLNGALSTDEESKMESQINKVSSDLHKIKLDKRVQSR